MSKFIEKSRVYFFKNYSNLVCSRQKTLVIARSFTPFPLLSLSLFAAYHNNFLVRVSISFEISATCLTKIFPSLVSKYFQNCSFDFLNDKRSGENVPLKMNKKISLYAEFSEFSRKQIQYFSGIFKKYDEDQDSYIDFNELKRMMEKLGEAQTHIALKELIKKVIYIFNDFCIIWKIEIPGWWRSRRQNFAARVFPDLQIGGQWRIVVLGSVQDARRKCWCLQGRCTRGSKLFPSKGMQIIVFVNCSVANFLRKFILWNNLSSS